MDPKVYARFCEIARKTAGLNLGSGKELLVSLRVARRVRALDCASVEDYLKVLEADRSGQELALFLTELTTNFTGFFREPDHFEELEALIRARLERGARRVRLWSAACSNGDEPYSMAIAACEALEGRDADVRILATDISLKVLARAREGVYPERSLEPLPKQLRLRYFEPAAPGDHGEPQFRVSARLREKVVFKYLNLAATPFPMTGPLDAVFCRNVMIYFDNLTRQRLLKEIERLLGPEGVLFTGHAETLVGLVTGLRTLRPSLFGAPAARLPEPSGALASPPKKRGRG